MSEGGTNGADKSVGLSKIEIKIEVIKSYSKDWSFYFFGMTIDIFNRERPDLLITYRIFLINMKLDTYAV